MSAAYWLLTAALAVAALAFIAFVAFCLWAERSVSRDLRDERGEA